MSFQNEVHVAKRKEIFCPSNSVRLTDGMYALNVCTCHVNNHFEQRDGWECNSEELSNT